MGKLGLCSVPSGRGGVDMIQCEKCFSWQHCQCAGVAPATFKRSPYVCCEDESKEVCDKV